MPVAGIKVKILVLSLAALSIPYGLLAEERRDKAGPCDITISQDFSAVAIDDSVFSRMKGKSYGAGCDVPLDSLRYLRLLYVDGDGETQRGDMVCNVAIADDLLDIFRSLYEARYPIERIGLIDDYDADDIKSMKANNTSAFNFRFIGNTRRLSNHSRGMAVDLNPLYNPYVKRRKDGTIVVSPEEGRPYVDRTADFPYKITKSDLAYKLFKSHGFKWGGEWKSLKDYQHFEK